ncbi:MAG: hypothetical protein WA948_00665, partial [Pontixanthobacter sp.]
SFRGPWRPHAANPVKCDVGSARPAGPVFTHKNALFRPSQNCTSHYGASVIINEIEILNDDRFQERAVSEVKLDANHRYDFGFHTLSSAGHFTTVDGGRLESRIHPSLDGLHRWLLA